MNKIDTKYQVIAKLQIAQHTQMRLHHFTVQIKQ